MTITGVGGGLGERGVGAGEAVAGAGAGGGVPGFFSDLDWTLITSGVCWMRSVEPVSLTAAGSPTVMAASLMVFMVGMATGVGVSGAATGVVSAECVEECKIAGAGVTGAGMDSG